MQYCQPLLLRFFHLNFHVIRQSVSTGGYDEFTLLHAFRDLHFAILLNTDLNIAPVRPAVRPYYHHVRRLIRLHYHRCFWRYESVRSAFCCDTHVDRAPRLELRPLIARLNPYFDCCAVWIERRADESHFPRTRALTRLRKFRRIACVQEFGC